MEKLKSSLRNMAVVLTGVAIVSGGILAAVNKVTAPTIEQINAENLAAGIQKVMGGGDIQVSEPDTLKATIEGKEKEFVSYEVSDASGSPMGTAIQSSENGFGGELKVLTGFSTDGTILGYTILQSSETPGLGAKANTWFQKENGERRTVVGKNPGKCNFTIGGDIDAITASTITSKAFIKAIRNAYDQLFGQAADAATSASAQQQK